LSKKVNIVLLVLFVIGAVVEGIRNGATLLLLQHSLFAVGIGLELLSGTDGEKRWPVTRILSVVTFVAATSLLIYHIFVD